MIRFYYIAFNSVMYVTHSGYTSNLAHFHLFIKDRLSYIADCGEENVNVGYVDAENSAFAINEILKRNPDCYMDGESEIFCYTITNTDRPCCFTFTEIEMSDEIMNQGYYAGAGGFEWGDMEIFNTIWKIYELAKLFFKDETVVSFLHEIAGIITWYMIIMLNLCDKSSCVNEFSQTFRDFINLVFGNRVDKLDKLGERSYMDFHDQIYDYYQNIIAVDTVSETQHQEITYLYKRYVDVLLDGRM